MFYCCSGDWYLFWWAMTGGVLLIDSVLVLGTDTLFWAACSGVLFVMVFPGNHCYILMCSTVMQLSDACITLLLPGDDVLHFLITDGMCRCHYLPVHVCWRLLMFVVLAIRDTILVLHTGGISLITPTILRYGRMPFRWLPLCWLLLMHSRAVSQCIVLLETVGIYSAVRCDTITPFHTDAGVIRAWCV